MSGRAPASCWGRRPRSGTLPLRNPHREHMRRPRSPHPVRSLAWLRMSPGQCRSGSRCTPPSGSRRRCCSCRPEYRIRSPSSTFLPAQSLGPLHVTGPPPATPPPPVPGLCTLAASAADRATASGCSVVRHRSQKRLPSLDRRRLTNSEGASVTPASVRCIRTRRPRP